MIRHLHINSIVLNEMEIEELVARCKDGDDAAIVTLYRLNIPRLKKICRRIVRNEQAAEDIVHDAFIIIITSLDSLKDSSRITSWMNRITINLSYEYMNVVLDGRYHFPLSRALKANPMNERHRFFTFSVGYRFSL